MAMFNGFMGKMLLVDLSTNKIDTLELTEDIAYDFLGGYGLGAKMLYNLMPAGADVFGPDSVIGFVNGPTNCTGTFFGGRYMVVSKSPVYNGWNDCNSGGFFGPELKKAGYDALFVKGIAEKPVYISIIEGVCEIKDASHLWGLDAKETWAALQKEYDNPKVRVTCIGSAGENMSHIACVVNDGHRAAGRGGSGAVMGSKKLKAVMAFGTKETMVADPEKIVEINKYVDDGLKGFPFIASRRYVGTSNTIIGSTVSGDAPVKNWAGSYPEDFTQEQVAKVSGNTMNAKYMTKRVYCATCPLGCGAEYDVEDGKWPVKDAGRPEYETANGFTANALCDNAEQMIVCNDICNSSGMDTISACGTVTWAMECYSNGILTKEELDGIELYWGNADAIVQIVDKMARADGCGAILANGSRYAARYWNKGYEALVEASGIEPGMHDPRFAPGMVRVYQYDPTPGRHVKGGIGSAHQQPASNTFVSKHDYRGTGYIDVRMAGNFDFTHAAGYCKFIGPMLPAPYKGEYVTAMELQADYLRAITGKAFTDRDVMLIGLRIHLMRSAFNLREGFYHTDMNFSDRAKGHPPLKTGPNAGVDIDDERLVRNYRAWLGVDEKGIPRLEVLKRLGNMDEVIRDLYGEEYV